ncbi:TPR-like protein [Tothia fuscella]|uniref:TPR-like protein n=1 Tax=Tothia fuscella TaxID=1048955 RepID=A0A9P4NGM5_9PEZI|nr:TPR-like protein [Tothia fuscella]
MGKPKVITAQTLYQDGKKLLVPPSWLESLVSGGKPLDRHADGAELLGQSADRYRNDGNLEAAAKTYEEASEAYEVQAQDKTPAAEHMVSAMNIYRQISKPDAVRCAQKAVKLAKEGWTFTRRNKLFETQAELYQQVGDLEGAKNAYSAAAEGYKLDNSIALSSKPANFAAELAARVAQTPDGYQDARDRFLEIAKSNMTQANLRFGVKGILLKAGICSLCFGDVITAQNDIQRFKAMERDFAQSRECRLLENLLEPLEEKDPVKWMALFDAYKDECMTVTDWHETMFKRQQAVLQEAENDFS